MSDVEPSCGIFVDWLKKASGAGGLTEGATTAGVAAEAVVGVANTFAGIGKDSPG